MASQPIALPVFFRRFFAAALSAAFFWRAMFKPVQKQSLTQQVFNQIRDSILNNTYRPGQRLPSERELCDALHINRSSLREALKRLEQARLIEIRHGEGSVVLDFKTTAGFDLLRDMVMPNGELNLLALRSIAEVRTLVTTHMAKLCAQRADKAYIDEICSIAKQIEQLGENSNKQFQNLDFAFHYAMAQASQNLALVLILNSIRDIYFEFQDFFEPMFSSARQEPAIYLKIAEAIRKKDANKAAKLTEKLVETGNRLFLDLARQMQETARQ